MENTPELGLFLNILEEAILENNIHKISLGNYQGAEADLKNIYIRYLLIKNKAHLSFTYRYKTKDIVKNYHLNDGFLLIKSFLIKGFNIGTAVLNNRELQIEVLRNGKVVLRDRKIADVSKTIKHDHLKQRSISTSVAFLHKLGITDSDGNVYKNGQDKFKQINHYIELLKPILKDLSIKSEFNVVDMGSGKGYLTFALTDYLNMQTKLNASVTGVEYRQDLVDLCNQIAKESKLSNLNFVQGTIEDFETSKINLLIALHACDTATDDAIYKGIISNADLIVVAPCCHKQVRKEIEQQKKINEISSITDSGVFLEKQAAMLTDTLRALYLQRAGYKTKIVEFISDAHTPKNIMITAVKQQKSERKTLEVEKKINQLHDFFGLKMHYLGKLLNIM